MLGATPSRFLGPSDEALRAVAEEMGRGETFHQPTVAVYFGEPGKTVPDPFFGGAGPARTGCTLCGGCMVGCRHGAKNTLDRNYLYLAERLGAVIHPLTTVERIEPLRRRSRRGLPRSPAGAPAASCAARGARQWRARQVVLAGGRAGHHAAAAAGPRAAAGCRRSPRAWARRCAPTPRRWWARPPAGASVDQSRGIAITSGFWPEAHTHVEIVRYGAGQDAMGRLGTLLAPGRRRRLAAAAALAGPDRPPPPRLPADAVALGLGPATAPSSSSCRPWRTRCAWPCAGARSPPAARARRRRPPTSPPPTWWRSGWPTGPAASPSDR